ELSDDWTVHSRARYTSMENDYQIAWGAGLQADQRTMNRFWFSGLPTLDITTVDNHVVTDFATGSLSHEFLVGLDYQRHILDERWEFGTADPIDVFDPNYGGDPLQAAFFTADTRREQDQVGVYVQDQIELNAWTLVLSGRQDWVDTESRDRVAGSTTEQSTDAFSGRIGLVYQTDGGLAPYASYSESFLPLLGTTASGEDFEPETGQQYEVGVKYQPDAANSYVTLAAFDLRRQNVLTPNPTDPTFQVQTGEIRSRGFEVEGVASLLSGLDLTATYTFLDTEVTESNAGDEGNRPIIVPEHAASMWADYTLQGGELEGLGFGFGLRYTGSTWGNAANTLKVPGYTLVDGTVHYDWQDFRLGLTASNVFDEAYVASCYDATSCFYGATRTVRADVAYRW
ncbi:MAG: TonB-dependent siderophore receptor, partial [Longimicrobiales bacterium]|nr:TonB-dependent siderophore receptor [Longimicrobiales bacterium]